MTAVVAATLVAWVMMGCSTGGGAHSAPSVRTATRDIHEAQPPASRQRMGFGDDAENSREVIAVVNGLPIARSRVVELLLRAHGAGILEQLMGLELAGELAAQHGISVKESDVLAEYDLALRRLSDPLAMVTPPDFDRESAERVLDLVLSERNISREEFLITIRRNAYLRQVAQLDLTISEEQLQTEYDRVYGERAEVRHIQLGSDGDVRRVRERLAAGDEFAALASRYSANVASAENGGLLEPFSRDDPAVPEAFRQAAFSLVPGEVSDVVQLGEWRHLIRLERIVPPDTRGPNLVRPRLEAQLRGRTAEQRMRELFDRLMREASIDIHDPNVREAFWNRRREQP